MIKLRADHPFYKQIVALQSFLSLGFVLCFVFILTRVYEGAVISSINNFPTGSWKYESIGLISDLLCSLKLLSLLAIPYFIIYYFNSKIAKIFFIVCSVLLTVIALALTQYFGQELVPFGAEIFGYSFSEMTHTAGASNAFSIYTLIPFVLVVALIIFLQIKFNVKEYPAIVLKVFYFLILPASLFFVSFGKQYTLGTTTEFNKFATTNKLSFFINSCRNYWNEKDAEEIKLDVISNTNQLATNTPSNNSPDNNYEFKYVSNDYPFLHEENTQNVLGQYFNIGNKPPNIVFLLVESLGRAYAGNDAYLGSFLPYFDSLSHQSLYWENMLSTTGRTFGVLPSVLASAPFGDNGFAEMGNDMPNHQSILKLLKKRGYSTHFYCGADAHFDNMDIFLKKQNIDEIIDEKKFDASYTKLPANDGGFTWGYGDQEIIKKNLIDLANKKNKPFLDVILTVAMHPPFKIPNQDFYLKQFEERQRELKLTNEQQEFNNAYKNCFATMIYFDDALRNLINTYKQNKDFENTIFVITGDHRMPEIPIRTQIDRFHVPLVIWSPMLKKAEKFSAVSSHFDITPTLLAFLRDSYGFNFAKHSAWIGHGLDAHVGFRNVHSYPMMRNKSEFLDYINHREYLASTSLYRVNDNLEIVDDQDEASNNEIKKLFDNFKTKNKYACKNNKLLPDSLLENGALTNPIVSNSPIIKDSGNHVSIQEVNKKNTTQSTTVTQTKAPIKEEPKKEVKQSVAKEPTKEPVREKQPAKKEEHKTAPKSIVGTYVIQTIGSKNLENAKKNKTAVQKITNKKIIIIHDNNLYKVCIVGFTDKDDAKNLLPVLEKKGVKGAFFFIFKESHAAEEVK